MGDAAFCEPTGRGSGRALQAGKVHPYPEEVSILGRTRRRPQATAPGREEGLVLVSASGSWALRSDSSRISPGGRMSKL